MVSDAAGGAGMIVETIHDCTDWGGPYLRTVLLPRKGDRGEQHAHQLTHATLCCNGAAEFWEDGLHIGNVSAGGVVQVKAGKPHFFVALLDETRLSCIFDAAAATEQRKL